MTKKKLQKPAVLEELEKQFEKALDAEKVAMEKAPKVHDHKKGEYIREVDPADADRHLE